MPVIEDKAEEAVEVLRAWMRTYAPDSCGFVMVLANPLDGAKTGDPPHRHAPQLIAPAHPRFVFELLAMAAEAVPTTMLAPVARIGDPVRH